MNICLKSIDVGGDYLSDHKPDSLEFFSLWITVTVGLVGQDGGSLYQLHVCTPDWIKYALQYEADDASLWGRHMLIVEKFDADKIEILIEKKVEEISMTFPDDEPVELSKKVGRYAHWEFEDYVPYEE